MLFRSAEEDVNGSFKSLQTAISSLDITDKEIYADDANKIQLVFNEQLGAAQSDVKLAAFFAVVVPKPADDSKTPWWVWVIIGLVVFLVIVGVLLYFLTKNKEQDEENDEYMTPEDEKKDQVKGSKKVDQDFE